MKSHQCIRIRINYAQPRLRIILRRPGRDTVGFLLLIPLTTMRTHKL